MTSVKSGSWFLELILNILLLAGVAFVTFAARGEQERGLAVPLFAAVSPATTRPAVEVPSQLPAVTAPANVPGVNVPDASAVVEGTSGAVQTAVSQGNQSFQQAWGALQIWAAGLDGKITGDELKKIQDAVGQGWTGTQSVRDYLRTVNEKINAGQADQIIQESLKTLGSQANDKKIEVMNSVAGFMKSNGITWEQTQRVMTQWVGQVLKMSPTDLWNALKF